MLMLQSLLLGAKADLMATGLRVRRTLIWGAVAAILFLTAYGFAVFALAVYLAEQYGPVAAALVVSAAAAALGIIIIACILVQNRMDRRRHIPMSLRMRRASELSAASTVGGLMQNRPVSTLALVALIAFAGTRIGLKK